MKIWTDGSASPNPGRGGWAYLIEAPDGVITTDFGTVEHSTNNQMELTAVLKAVSSLPKNTGATIYTDSENVRGWLCLGWNRKVSAVKTLCEEIEQVIATKNLSLKFVVVRGHGSDCNNNIVDKLAVKARS